MTKFSFEVPIHHLDDFDDLQDYYFTLSMLYSDPTYRGFFERQSLKGEKTIWLDNSYNEKMSADNLVELATIADYLNPQKVISPDSPDWSTEQIKHAFIEAQDFFLTKELIVVVSSLEMYLEMQEFDARHFAISYWTRPKLQDVIKKILPCHFLGLLSVEEIPKFKPPTCDTSMPIKLAIEGKSLRDWANGGYPHICTHQMGHQGEDFFHMRMTKEQVRLARLNIIKLKEICNEEG